jgi:hypothetical protein
MARTLAQIDADLAIAETRITQLVNAGQNLKARVDAIDPLLADLGTRLDGVDPALRRIVRSAKREVMNIRQELVRLQPIADELAGTPTRRPRPGRNPLVKMVVGTAGRLVARSRLSR